MSLKSVNVCSFPFIFSVFQFSRSGERRSVEEESQFECTEDECDRGGRESSGAALFAVLQEGRVVLSLVEQSRSSGVPQRRPLCSNRSFSSTSSPSCSICRRLTVLLFYRFSLFFHILIYICIYLNHVQLHNQFYFCFRLVIV